MLLRIFTEPQQGASYDDLLAVARKTEECGFDAFFRSDHYLVMGDQDGLPGPTDAWITLAGLARETSRIKLGTLVSSATFRNPGVLAISVAQVDQMSGGRAELGLGAGWYEAEHAAYGLDFPDTPGRFDLLTEQLELITGLWDTPLGEKYDFAGKHYQLKDSPALPKPVQQPHPPVIVGGAGKKRTPALAAKYAAEFNAGFRSVEETQVLFDRVQEACRAIGRDPQTLALSTAHTVVVGKDDAQVKQRAAAIGRDADELIENAVAGTPAQVVDRLGRFAEAGSQRQYVQIMDLADLDHLDLIAAEVLPHVS
ncbi:LLM class F420-dependent oxidoreductase [Kribbella sp. VKM Ac-2568]|uniref:LLM class F420-dependent oxidoreductase n=1 Tax=Kribbella sp. VKM Ac-2568 TaxID=2512219 RepID=UPI0010481E17|nr:LLM class F420-dependent oxidoreductase [Kribbella sp. VKM Ac-2568]TCM49991.1 F420-dependent oxidoreductase-like protein [Kribbella sp. VKM Ac-2568]